MLLDVAVIFGRTCTVMRARVVRCQADRITVKAYQGGDEAVNVTIWHGEWWRRTGLGVMECSILVWISGLRAVPSKEGTTLQRTAYNVHMCWSPLPLQRGVPVSNPRVRGMMRQRRCSGRMTRTVPVKPLANERCDEERCGVHACWPGATLTAHCLQSGGVGPKLVLRNGTSLRTGVRRAVGMAPFQKDSDVVTSSRLCLSRTGLC
ncbi:hypothetical protein EJ04DRAFT_196127 [Polyplosphaeria fusca]|uniref:Uncharacterized protein n=1 Tax=Polyplosphaeria fusca TaxID=682080 RepID=A0A9P4V4M8_9PLEO|nr:hypothetical protein EJ04DRAFT_196127 [Polyplosphaeria fusca]